ncbi:rhomboid family protein [Candidatus Magnetobacterium bavaricum]|uniref:Rhomboid family protein n=1 Tax=Candidatus Magnetobacterium bavaricum TaxID=29290 RepID=A0A0F3GU17_9BACT|nr:rhomboid family protein [Candidatus Magnetobacterium bavaricum]
MSSNKTYSVVFDGIILAGYDEIEVKKGLCNYCKVDFNSLKGKRILAGYPVVVKGGLDLATATMLKRLLDTMGAECSMVSHRSENRTLKCPQCRHHVLTTSRYKDIALDTCSRCGGLWFEKHSLDKILLSHDKDDKDSMYTPSIIENLGAYKGQTTRHCPDCQIPMKRYDLAQGSGLEISVCAECYGIWLEKEKIEQARAFYEIPSVKEALEKKPTWQHWVFQFVLSLPVEFNIKPRRFPVVVATIITINVLMMLVAIVQDSPEEFTKRFGLLAGANKTFFWFLTLISYQFLHGGLFHIVGNMYFLYVLGDNVEDALGRIHYPVFYLVCGVVAGLTQTIFTSSPQVPVVGASGAVAGVMTAYMVIFRKARLTFMFVFWQKKLSAKWYFGIWILMNLSGLLFSRELVAWYAHLGGFVTGLVWSYMVYDRVIQRHPLLNYINKSP